MTGIFLKDPAERLDYTENWADFLGEDTISASAWSIPTGLTSYATSNDTTTTAIWLTGGTHGQEYLVTNLITTTLGRIADRSIKLLIRNR